MEIIKIEIATGWDSVTVGQWQELTALNAADFDNDARLLIEQLSILTDLDSATIEKLPMSEVNKLSDIISLWDNKQLDKHADTFTLDGVEYGIVKANMITFGEWVDLETYVKDPVANMHHIISVLYRPIIAKKGRYYTIADYNATEAQRNAENIAQHVTLDKVYNAMVFFCTIGTPSIVRSLTSLV